jgi:large conductance mechanosensitive channel
MAHGGIAILAIVFAVALAVFEVAREIGRETISVLNQKLYDEDGEDPLGFTIAGTQIHWGTTLSYVIALALVLVLLYGIWRVMRGSVRSCPECRSTIPLQASICRYCTSELTEVGADA